MTTQIKNRGFTLVELLIVIVIIAILTVVSLVAYNGLQNQAKTSTAKSTADSIAKKAELYNTETGRYPDSLTVLTQTTVTPVGGGTPVSNTGNSYYIAASNVTPGTITDGTAPTNTNTIEYTPCGPSSSPTGANIKYYNYSDSKGETRTVGTC